MKKKSGKWRKRGLPYKVNTDEVILIYIYIHSYSVDRQCPYPKDNL